MVRWSSQGNLTKIKIPDLYKLFILVGLVIDGMLCPGLCELLQRVVVPHIVSLASGAGLVHEGDAVADVALRRTIWRMDKNCNQE